MSNRRIEMRWALIFTASALAWMSLERALGWHDVHISKHATYTNLFSLVAIAVFAFALIDKRNRFYGGIMTWRQGFTSGLVISVFVAVLSPASQWVTSTIITPHYFDNAIAFSVESGHASLEEAQSTSNLTNYIIQATIGALVMGAMTSAVVALFVRRRQRRRLDAEPN